MNRAGGAKFFMLETHYDNPNLQSGIVDHSGLRLFYTSQLRYNFLLLLLYIFLKQNIYYSQYALLCSVVRKCFDSEGLVSRKRVVERLFLLFFVVDPFGGEKKESIEKPSVECQTINSNTQRIQAVKDDQRKQKRQSEVSLSL